MSAQAEKRNVGGRPKGSKTTCELPITVKRQLLKQMTTRAIDCHDVAAQDALFLLMLKEG